MDIRPYEPGDETSIRALFKHVFSREISDDWWRWRFLENPVDRPRIVLAWDGNELASHYAVSPLNLRVGNDIVLAALSMTTMTSPEYRGHGLFPRLAEALYDELAAAGYQAVIGFPNAQSHVPFVETLKWQDIAAVHNLRVRPDELRSTTIRGDWLFESRAPGLEDTDSLLVVAEQGVSVEWGADAWMWRTSAASGQDYRVLRCTNAEDATCSAVLVWKNYGDEDVDIVHFSSTIPAALLAAVCKLCGQMFENGKTSINTWSSVHQPAHRCFERLGFRVAAPVTYFGGRHLQSRGDILSPHRWQITMLASDVY